MRPTTSILLAALLCPGLPCTAQGQERPLAVDLERALELFHENSPELATARSRLRREIANSRQGRALPNPTASFTNEDVGEYSERYLNVTQRVDFLWGVGARAQRADAEGLSAHTRFQADSALFVFEVKRTYLKAWQENERVLALRRVDGIVEALLQAAAARFAEGDLAGYDVRRLTVERSAAARRLAQAEVGLSYAEEHLGSLVGETGVQRLRAEAMAGEAPSLSADFDATSRALAARPELAGARAVVHAREADVALARAGIASGASLTGGLKQQSDGHSGLFLGVELPIPLLDRRSGAADAARAAVQGAESEAESLRRGVAREASLARARLTSVQGLSVLLGDGGVEESVELLRIARIAYDEGEVGIVELLDAADAYLEAHLLRTAIRVDGWLAYFELEQAVGGLANSVDRGVER